MTGKIPLPIDVCISFSVKARKEVLVQSKIVPHLYNDCLDSMSVQTGYEWAEQTLLS